MTKVGEHITLDIIGTKKEYESSFFEKLVYKIAKKAKVTILEISKYKFKPQGFTLVALLAESHMSFHTFPENNIISFDFFTCGNISPSVGLTFSLSIFSNDGKTSAIFSTFRLSQHEGNTVLSTIDSGRECQKKEG